MDLPLFPLRTVLCPGVALPLHIFEERYRLMINRCIQDGSAFGVVLLHDGREVGPLTGRLAEVGTTALIREAGKYPDGRLEIMTVGGQRFRIDRLVEDEQPYLVGRVTLLDEPLGAEAEAATLAERVSTRFLEYLDLLQAAFADDTGPEIEVEVEIETSDDPEIEHRADSSALNRTERSEETEPIELLGADPGGTRPDRAAAGDDETASAKDRRELLMAAARRLTAPGDPTVLSYVLTGLVQVELAARQRLLEAPDTVERLSLLQQLIGRELWLLERGLKPLILDPGSPRLRRN